MIPELDQCRILNLKPYLSSNNSELLHFMEMLFSS